MATDWAADVKKFAPHADDAVVEKMVSTYRLVLSKADTASVAYSDPAELDRVRENFLKKKLGLTLSDAEPVSYTHLDVYKRQPSTTRSSRSRIPRAL